MEVTIQRYYDNLLKPWSKMFYKMLYKQLEFAKNLRVLDFGSGFGIMADYLASQNSVVAIEPNIEMVKNRFNANNYQQLCGSLDMLKTLESQSFDLIVCHNVLEYLEDKDPIIQEFYRLLKKEGILSLVKHNHNGRIMQKVVYENNIDEAISILHGGKSCAESFGEIRYYSNDDIVNLNKGLTIENIYGVRTFWALQQSNEIKYEKSWFENMLKMEEEVCQLEDFVKISFFNHLIIKKV